MERIESPANDKIKLAASLAKSNGRKKEGAFVVEGVRLCEEALKAAEKGDWLIRFGFITAAQLAAERGGALAAKALEMGLALYEIPENVYNKAAQVVSPQGVLLVVKCKRFAPDDLISVCRNRKKAPLIAALDGVQDPGNVGTILRTAEATGATGAIFLPGTADVFGEKTVRASMGAIFRLPVSFLTAGELVSFADDHGLGLYATALDRNARPHTAANFVEPSLIVFGREGSGVSKEILAAAGTGKIFIPMAGEAESFNVAQACAIVLYEAFRQRQLKD